MKAPGERSAGAFFMHGACRLTRFSLALALCWLSGLALVLTGGTAQLAAKELSLGPVTAWQSNRNGDTCAVRRAFGSARQPVWMEFSGSGGLGQFRAATWGKPLLPLVYTKKLQVFVGDAEIATGAAEWFKTVTADGSVIMQLVPEAVMAASSTAPTLRIVSGRNAAAIDTGPLSTPIGLLQECRDGILREWGLDPYALRTGRKLASPIDSPGGWIRASDFPLAYYTRVKTDIRFTVIVDAAGAVAGCHTQNRDGDVEVQALMCRLLRERAHFSPGLDSEGRPAPSYYSSMVRWYVG